MKSVYKCEVCGAMFDDEKECAACEARHAEKETQKREMAQKSQEINRLIKQFVNDYQVFPDIQYENDDVVFKLRAKKDPTKLGARYWDFVWDVLGGI